VVRDPYPFHELELATSPELFDAYMQRSDPDAPSRAAVVVGMDARRDDGGEGLTDSLIRERTLPPDQAPAHSPPLPTTSPTGPTGDVTTDLIRDPQAPETELERLRRREAWMTAALAQASRAGFVYINGDDSPIMQHPASVPMRQTPTTTATSSSSSSNIECIFVAALKSYKGKTGKDLKNHDLFKQLETCDSPTAILAVFQAAQFDISQTGGACRLKKWLFQTLNVLLDVLCAFSDILGEGVSSVIINLFAPLSTNKF
jgi:hypothetical protein